MESTAEQTANYCHTVDDVRVNYAKVRPRYIHWSQMAGFAIFGAMLFLTLWDSTDGHPSAFVTTTGVMLMLGCTGALLLATFGGSGAWQAIRAPFTSVPTADEHRAAVSFFQLGAVYALASGLIGLFIGMVAMFRNMGGDSSAIGKALAVALLTLFYGVILAAIFLVLAAIVSRREQNSGTVAAVARQALPIGVGAAVVGTLVCLLLPSLIVFLATDAR
jgi:hypothetical protein